MTTLCIIDMQEYFNASKTALPEVLREIKLAKRRKAGIIIVEYKGCGRSWESILDLVKDYDKIEYVIKNAPNGGPQVVKACDKKGFDRKKLRICGVNRGACVFETIEGVKKIAKKKQEEVKFEIAINATWCTSPRYGRHILKDLGKFVNSKKQIKEKYHA